MESRCSSCGWTHLFPQLSVSGEYIDGHSDPESTILHAEEDLLEEPTYDHDNILGYNSDLSNDLSHLQPDLNTTHDDDHEDPWVDSDSDHEAATSAPPPRTIKKNTRKPRALRQSAYGIDYAPLPPAVIRKLASQLSATKLSKDTLRVLDEASEAFFRQTADSLRAFARHAGRKTVDESDVVQLMMRWVGVGGLMWYWMELADDDSQAAAD